jgi:hypothetical protein
LIVIVTKRGFPQRLGNRRANAVVRYESPLFLLTFPASVRSPSNGRVLAKRQRLAGSGGKNVPPAARPQRQPPRFCY